MSSPAVGWVTRRRLRGKCLILAYHGIIPEGQSPAGERALFIRQSEFARQLDALTNEAEVVRLDEINASGDSRPRIAITFDDAYAGAVNEGVRELAARNLPATIFVAPGRLNGHVFWWDALANGHEELDPDTRRHALHALSGADESVRNWAARAAMPLSDALPAYARAATREELHAAMTLPGMTVGAHSWSHRNLAALSPDDVIAEVRDSRDWLRAEFGAKAVNWFAYPYGFDSDLVHRALEEASFAGAVRIGGGWHRAAESSRFTRPRFGVGPGLSMAAFRAHLIGGRLG